MLNEISIEITRKCANNCIHCSSMSSPTCKEELSFIKFKEIVEDAQKLGAKTICFSGGEPFLHKDIVDMIQFVASLKMQSYIYTSGIIMDNMGKATSIDKEILTKISPFVTKLIFNVEAGTHKTYDLIMGTSDCFIHLLNSIESASKASIKVEAHFVPMKININEIDEVVELCENLNISKLSFLRLVVHGRAKKNQEQIELSPSEYLHLKDRLQKIKYNSKIDIRIGIPLDSKKSCIKCEAASGKLNIKYDGYVFPCEVFKNNATGIKGNDLFPNNIHDSSLLDIYRSSTYLEHVRSCAKKFIESNLSETCLGQHLINTKGNCDLYE